MDLLTVDETAARLRTSRKTVRRLLRSGEIEAFRLDGAWRVSKTALNRFLQSRKNTRYAPNFSTKDG